MKLLAQFDLDVFPPSNNHIQQSGRGGFRYDSNEYKQFKADFAHMVGDKLKPLAIHDGKPLMLDLTYFWSGWFTKSGRIRKGRDVSNRIKALEDAIFRDIGLDDSLNFRVTASKGYPVNGRDRFVDVKIFEMESI